MGQNEYIITALVLLIVGIFVIYLDVSYLGGLSTMYSSLVLMFGIIFTGLGIAMSIYRVKNR